MIELIKDLFRKFSHTWVGLATGFFLTFLTIVIPVDSFLQKGIQNFYVRLIVYGMFEIIWLISWLFYRNYLPKTKVGKVGVFIAINAENDKQKRRIKYDFVNGIEKSLKENNLSKLVQVNTLEDFRAKNISKLLNKYSEVKYKTKTQRFMSSMNKKTLTQFNKVRKKINAHFFIWGLIKERMEAENRYFLTLDGLVVHKPVDVNTSNAIIVEFLNIFPKEISVIERFEFQGFEIASNLIYIAISYMSGIAAFVSGDPFTAFKMHKGLLRELKKYDPMPPNLSHVVNNVIALQATELFQQSRYHYFVKRDNNKADQLIELAEKLDNKNYDIKIFKCYRAFADHRDVSNALKYADSACEAARKLVVEDFTWLYNKAFLLIYSGKFAEAVKLYDELENKEFMREESIVKQCLQFDSKVLDQEPDKIQIYYVLGFLYLKKKTNLEKARYHFNVLIEKASNNVRYKLLCDRSRLYLSQMN